MSAHETMVMASAGPSFSSILGGPIRYQARCSCGWRSEPTGNGDPIELYGPPWLVAEFWGHQHELEERLLWGDGSDQEFVGILNMTEVAE